MDKQLKNIDSSTILKLEGQVDYQNGQIVSKTLVQNNAVSLTLFAFDKNEEISTHESNGDALVTVLDGVCQVSIADEKYIVNAGESIVMPANISHSVYANEKFKMLLTIIF